MAEKSLTGLPKNTAAALSYVLGPISAIIFYILEKDPFVRYHAVQSFVVFVVLMLVQFALFVVFAPLGGLMNIVFFISWLVLIYKAWQGEEWEYPILGQYAKKFGKKVEAGK